MCPRRAPARYGEVGVQVGDRVSEGDLILLLDDGRRRRHPAQAPMRERYRDAARRRMTPRQLWLGQRRV